LEAGQATLRISHRGSTRNAKPIDFVFKLGGLLSFPQISLPHSPLLRTTASVSAQEWADHLGIAVEKVNEDLDEIKLISSPQPLAQGYCGTAG
jgi:hypothetical protein